MKDEDKLNEGAKCKLRKKRGEGRRGFKIGDWRRERSVQIERRGGEEYRMYRLYILYRLYRLKEISKD